MGSDGEIRISPELQRLGRDGETLSGKIYNIKPIREYLEERFPQITTTGVFIFMDSEGITSAPESMNEKFSKYYETEDDTELNK